MYSYSRDKIDIEYMHQVQTNFKAYTHIIIFHHVHQETHKPSYMYLFILNILKKDQNVFNECMSFHDQ